jgi:hypothetical protein
MYEIKSGNNIPHEILDFEENFMSPTAERY